MTTTIYAHDLHEILFPRGLASLFLSPRPKPRDCLRDFAESRRPGRSRADLLTISLTLQSCLRLAYLRGEKTESRSGLSVVRRQLFSLSQYRAVTQRGGRASRRRSARRRGRSHTLSKVSCDPGTECGRRRTGDPYRERHSVPTVVAERGDYTRATHVIKRSYILILAPGPFDFLSLFLFDRSSSLTLSFSLSLLYCIRNYIIYTPQIYIYIYIYTTYS